MSQPPIYSPQTSFITYQAQQAWFPGQQLDVEFNALKTSVDDIISNLSIIQRDDGQLANGSVGADQLNATLKAQLQQAGFVPVSILQGPLNLAASGVNRGFNITQAASGLISGVAEQYLNLINITSDTVSTPLGLNALGINYSFGGPTVDGTRSGLIIQLTQTAPTDPSSGNDSVRFYVASTPAVFVNGSGDGGTDTSLANSKGGYYGENPQVRTTATNVRYVIGSESNPFGTSAATQAYQIGYNSLGIFVNNGAIFDAAFAAGMSASGTWGAVSPGPGWTYGFVAAELGNGYVPISPTGTFLGVFLQTLSTVPVAYGIDIRKLTASQKQVIGVNFSIDPSGNPSFGPGSGTGLATAIVDGGSAGGSAGAAIGVRNAGVGMISIGNVSALFGGAYSNVGGITAFFGLKLYTNNVVALAIDTSQNVTLAAALNVNTLNLGASGTLGQAIFGNATSGTVTLKPVTGALGSVTLSLPAVTDTLAVLAGAQTLTNKTIAFASNTLTGVAPLASPTFTGTVAVPAITISAVQVVGARQTGWTVATGTPQRSTFTTSGVTLAQLAGVVMALEQDLITHGLIGT